MKPIEGDSAPQGGPASLPEWDEWLAAERAGARPRVRAALDALVDALVALPEAERAAWADRLTSAGDGVDGRSHGGDDTAGGHVPLRTPLFERVVFPRLRARMEAGDAAAWRATAKLFQTLIRSRACWEALGWPSAETLWRRAYELEPTEEARAAIVGERMDWIRETLHEVPLGVLYGQNGATLAECDELDAALAEVRAWMTADEERRWSRLLAAAELHYRLYREYLVAGRRQGYAAFLAERGIVGDEP